MLSFANRAEQDKFRSGHQSWEQRAQWPIVTNFAFGAPAERPVTLAQVGLSMKFHSLYSAADQL